jgi:hypothetical protein
MKAYPVHGCISAHICVGGALVRPGPDPTDRLDLVRMSRRALMDLSWMGATSINAASGLDLVPYCAVCVTISTHIFSALTWRDDFLLIYVYMYIYIIYIYM